MPLLLPLFVHWCLLLPLFLLLPSTRSILGLFLLPLLLLFLSFHLFPLLLLLLFIHLFHLLHSSPPSSSEEGPSLDMGAIEAEFGKTSETSLKRDLTVYLMYCFFFFFYIVLAIYLLYRLV